MAFVPGYEYDVFISYGHSDDAPPSAHWVRDLAGHVEGKLHQIFSGDVKIWRDPRLMAGDRLTPAIKEAIERSAVFVSVLTPGFVQQPWCAQEIAWFREAVDRDALKLGAKSRLIAVEKYPTDEASIARLMDTETLRQLFYRQGSEGTAPVDFSNDQRLETYPSFVSACDSLSHSIISALLTVRRAIDQQPVTPAQRSVFVAAVGSDVKQYREAIVKELVDRGFRVNQPSLSIEDSEEQVRAAVLEAASGSDLALHIDSTPGIRIGNLPLALAQFAIVRQEASGRPANRPLKQVIWTPSADSQAIEQVRRRFVAAVPNDATTSPQLDFEVLGGSVGALKEALLDIAAVPAPVERGASPVPAVYFLCQLADLRDPELQALRSWLVARDWVADLPPFQGDVALLTGLEERSIIEADATIIYYGSAQDWWVREKRRAIQQAWARSDIEMPRNRAIYLAVPEDELKQLQYPSLPKPILREKDGFAPLLILGDCGPFDQGKLQPLVDRMGGAARQVGP